MDQCYNNLVIVEQIGNAGHEKKRDAALSKVSLFARQKVETPDITVQVELPAIFDPRGGRQIQPRRIMIRGEAGAGKTTLCKKIVYDFTHGTQTALHRSWTKLFDRLLWVPLRNLKSRSPTGYNHEDLFYHEYFAAQGHDDGRNLARELWRELKVTNKTLFVLDGLDEVSHNLHAGDDMSRFLMELLNQPNVIITSRPNANLPAGIQDLDLELETIGFYPDQVKAYLEADPEIKQHANEVQSFLQNHWLMQGLVRIPILLDALCYTWKGFDSSTAADTMTCIYRAIELKLWTKDAVRLKMFKSDGISPLPTEIERIVAIEIDALECLAFNGLYGGVIDFTPTHQNHIVKQFRLRWRPLDATLAELSFLRTSDPLSSPKNRNYHFIHLTYQEYFAARYFVRKWKYDEQLEYVFNREQNPHSNPLIDPTKFLRRYKYSARYSVFWRFVSGLLDSDDEGDRETLRFFQNIEEEPRDLLGPTHQRLVMHCLNELVPREGRSKLSQFNQFQSKLEDQLSRWILFECEFTKRPPRLAGERELSDQVLLRALAEASDKTKKN